MLETLLIKIDAMSGGAVRDLEKTAAAAAGVGAEQQVLNGKTKESSGVAATWGKRWSEASLVTKTGLAAGAVAAVGLFKVLSEGVDKFVNLAGGVRLVQQATNATAESSSRAVAVFDDYGVSAEVVAKGLSRLGREAATGGGNLRKYGADIVYAKDGNVDLEKTLLSVATAYSSTEDPAVRAALVQAAFGRGGRDLIPVLEQGRDAIERMFASVPEGQILSQKDLQNAREYELAMDNLDDAVMELEMAMAQGLVPTLSAAADGFADIIRVGNEVFDVVGGLGNAIGGYFKAIISPAKLAYDSLSSLTNIDPIGDAFSDDGQTVRELKQELKGWQEQLDHGNESARRMIEVTREKIRAAEDDAEATGKSAEAEQKRAEAQALSSKAVQDATAAVWAKIDADRAAESSVLAVQKAQEDYNAVMADPASSPVERSEAEGRYKDAIIATAKAKGEAAAADLGPNATAAERFKASTDAQVASLGFLMAQASGPVKQAIAGYIIQLLAVPASVSTKVYADTWSAETAIQALIAKYSGVNFGYGVVTEVGIRRTHERASGGPIPGNPSQAVPIIAHGGEYVLSADVVSRIKNGRPSEGASVSGGAPGGGDAYFQIIVDPLSGSAMVQRLSEHQNTGGAVPWQKA